MKITEIAYTAYPVTDMKRARAFYDDLFESQPTMVGGDEECGYWVEYEVQGQVFAIANISPEWKPVSDGASIALEVEDLDAAIAECKAKNIPIVFGPMESPVCHMLGIADPDGSQIILHKRKSFSTH